MLNIKYNCVFGGGGVRGVCYVGAVKALEECGIELNAIAGSSVGAVFAMLYAVGYTASEIKEFFMEFNFNMFRDINVHIFDGDISFSKGEIFLDWLREKIETKFYGENYEKGVSKSVCFKDLKKDLSILTLDINTNEPFIFSKQTTPDEEIAFAVRISAGMPGLMKPIQINERILVDGDLIKTRPAFKIYDNLNTSFTRLLEFRLEGTRNSSTIKNPSDYINSVISTTWYLSTEHIYDLYQENDRYDFIIIDAKEVIMFDFKLDKTIREKLIDKGYKTTKHYLTDTLIKKKQYLVEIYKKILENLILIQKEADKNNAYMAVNIVNEILSNMVEYNKYIDNSIYNWIRDLKITIINNTKRELIFTDKIKNQKLVKNRIKFVITIVTERINDINDYIETQKTCGELKNCKDL